MAFQKVFEGRQEMPSGNEQEKERLEVFRDEILALQTAERLDEAEDKPERTAHFTAPEFDVHELTGDDLRIYEKLKNSSLTEEELAAYTQALQESGALLDTEGKRTSRNYFAAYVNNKAFALFVKRHKARREFS